MTEANTYGDTLPPPAYPVRNDTMRQQGLAPAPRIRQPLAPQQPPQPTQTPFLPGKNAAAAMDATTREQQYITNNFNDWYAKQQPQPPAPPPSLAPPVAGLTAPVDGPPNPAAALQPHVDGPPATSAPPIAPAPGGSISMTNDQGVTTSASYPSIAPAPQVGDVGTLKGSFPVHDAQGNVVPNQYKTVDASAPRDATNIAAIAKDNARNSPAFQQHLQQDPGYLAAQKKIADVQAATKARMSPDDYAKQQQAASDFKASIPTGVSEADWAAMKPNERATFTQRQQTESARAAAQGDSATQRQASDKARLDQQAKFEKDRIDQQRQSRNDAMLKDLGAGVSGLVKRGLTSFDKWVDMNAKRRAATAKMAVDRENGFAALTERYRTHRGDLKSTYMKQHPGATDEQIENWLSPQDQAYDANVAQLYPEFAKPQPGQAPAAPQNAPAPQATQAATVSPVAQAAPLPIGSPHMGSTVARTGKAADGSRVYQLADGRVVDQQGNPAK